MHGKVIAVTSLSEFAQCECVCFFVACADVCRYCCKWTIMEGRHSSQSLRGLQARGRSDILIRSIQDKSFISTLLLLSVFWIRGLQLISLNYAIANLFDSSIIKI